MKPTKQTKTQEQAQATPEPNAIDWGQYTGDSGFENVSQSDLGIPFLSVIQPKGPEVDRAHKDFATKQIVGSEAGDIINTVSRKVLVKYGKGAIVVVPAGYEKIYVEWKPKRGGMVRIHRNPEVLKEVTGKTEKNEDVLRNGNLLIETASFYVIIPDGINEPLQAIINMVSTQLKHARHWLNIMTGLRVGPNRIQPPMFSHSYQLSSIIETNDKGSWYGWKIQIHEVVNDRNLVSLAMGVTKRVYLLANQIKAQIPASVPSNDDVPM